ncbi:tetratricopeptide repeat protein [Devosia limi]|nr:hypothetical protein [Devosia limi]
MRPWIGRRPDLIAALLGPILLLLVLTGMTRAQDERDPQILDQLFAQLRIAPGAAAARAIDQKIWIAWTSPADPPLAARMREILVLRSGMDLPTAMDLLNQLVVDYPEYAEGWNQRATLHYLMSDYAASLADIEKVLQFEPRHFGALVGRAMIYRSQGKQALALRDMAAALAIHPFLVERALFPELLDGVTRI